MIQSLRVSLNFKCFDVRSEFLSLITLLALLLIYLLVLVLNEPNRNLQTLGANQRSTTTAANQNNKFSDSLTATVDPFLPAPPFRLKICDKYE